MKFLVGDDTGILKWVRVEAQKIERFGPQRRGDAADRLCFAGPCGNREERVVVAYASGVLELRDGTSGQIIAAAKGAPKVRRVEALGSGLLSVSMDGSAHVVEEWCGDNCPRAAGGPERPGCRVTAGHKGHAVVADEPPGIGKDDAPQARSFTLPGPVADARLDPCGSQRLAFGGNDNDLKLFDIEKGEVCWRAKNTKDNFLCLRIPNRISSLQWATPVAPSRSLLMTSTTDAKIRLYDASAQRRPLFEFQIGFGAGHGTGGYTGTTDDIARPIMCSALAQVRGKQWGFFVGNTVGVLREYDLRMLPDAKTAEIPPGRKSHLKWASRQLPFRRGYKGCMGSIRALEVHRSGDALVAAGLGRFAYVFETRKHTMVSKVYLKQKLCSVLISGEERQGGRDDDSDAEGSEGGEGGGRDAPPEVAGPQEEDEIEEGFSDDDECAGGEGGDDGAANAGSAEADEDGRGIGDCEPAVAIHKAAKGKKRRRPKAPVRAARKRKEQRIEEI